MDSPDEVDEKMVKREVIKEEDEDMEGQGADLFNMSVDAEEIDDKAGVQAAIMSGLLSAEVKDEEERIAAETARLQKLLGKSKFYTDFLLKKMQGHEAAMELKKQTNEVRAKKRAEKEAAAVSNEKRRTGRNKESDVEVKSNNK